MLQLVYVLLLLICLAHGYGDEVTVRVDNGLLQGCKVQGDVDYMSFVGVPYAQPPIGQLRFADPIAKHPWPGVWHANQTVACIQLNHFDDENARYGLDGEEDCLYLNIYVPGSVINSTARHNVVVFIHGGGFMFGEGHSYLPDNIIAQNAIFITLNYRLGLLGFLSTEDKNLPGNMGLKDQAMALRWIKENVKRFGGDPNQIMLTGHSAGGASVQFHLMSRQSRGLFNKAIMISGCALNPWSYQENALMKARQLADHLGCSNTVDTSKLVDCLRTRTARQITEATRIFRPWLYNPFSPVSVVVDAKHSSHPFFKAHPYELLSNGDIADVPTIMSSVTAEGLYGGAEYIKYPKYLPELNDNWDQYASPVLDYNGTIPFDRQINVAHQIKSHYLGNRTIIDRESYPNLIKMISDRLYNVDLESAAKLQAKSSTSNVFYYLYDYTTKYREGTVTYLLANTTESFGVGHGDDMVLILHTKTSQLEADDAAMSNFLLDIWMRFQSSVRTGVNGWQPVSRNINDEFKYLYIGAPGKYSMQSNSEFGEKSFWHGLKFAENANLVTR